MSNDILSPDPNPETQDLPVVTGRFERLFREGQVAVSYCLLLVALFSTVALITSTAANTLPGVIPFEAPHATAIAAAASSLMFLALALLFERTHGPFAGTIRRLASRSRRLLGILGVRRTPRQALTATLLGLAGGALAVGFQKFLFLLVSFPPSTQPDARIIGIANVSPAVGGAYFAIYAPFHEEIYYRGLLLLVVAAFALRSSSRRTQRAAMLITLIFTSVWFGYTHLDWSIANAVSAGFEGLIFGALALQQRSIWPAVIAHSAMNFGVAVFLL
jgi:membrane protease YdiL (CAAX protease family)